MVFLALIALAQLVVSILILGALAESADQTSGVPPAQSIASIERETLHAMLRAEEQARRDAVNS